MISILPIIPHFSNECLELINCKKIDWPKIDEKILEESTSNIVIQINGKKRALLNVQTNITEKELIEIIHENEQLKKYLDKTEIKRKIYIKNKLMNIII